MDDAELLTVLNELCECKLRNLIIALHKEAKTLVYQLV